MLSNAIAEDVERLADRIVMIHEGGVLIDSSLDELHEGFSLAMVPRGNGMTRDSLLSLDHCIGVRERPAAYHAILRLAPSEAQAELARGLGVSGTQCQAIALEDMFVELAGGKQ